MSNGIVNSGVIQEELSNFVKMEESSGQLLFIWDCEVQVEMLLRNPRSVLPEDLESLLKAWV